MRPGAKTWLYIAFCLLLTACGYPRAKSEKDFDEIREMVKGKTSSEIERMLGEPDSKQEMTSTAQRWIWWNYTYLRGPDYPPEWHRKVVHLEIILEPDGWAGVAPAASPGELRASNPFGINYSFPPKDR